MSPPDAKFYSLLHVDLVRNRKHVNLKSSATNAIDTYVACSRLLAASCRYFGVSYAVVTNETDFLRERVEALGGGVDVCDGDFDRAVPEDAKFYSAHFKLDLIRAMGEGRFGVKVALLDIDTVLTKRFDLPADAWCHDRLFVYDLSETEIQAYGEGRIQKSLQGLGVQSSERPRWFGGEFLLGDFRVFSKLSREIDKLWPAYRTSWHLTHHVGDEMVVTAALISLLQQGITITDAGQAVCPSGAPLVARWWSARTRAPQAPFGVAARAALLHLPADKPFLARQSRRNYVPEEFGEAYRRYLGPRLLARRVLNGLSRPGPGNARFVGYVD